MDNLQPQSGDLKIQENWFIMWIVENFSKETTEARNNEEKK